MYEDVSFMDRLIISTILIAMILAMSCTEEETKEESMGTESFLTIQDIENRYNRTSEVELPEKIEIEEVEKEEVVVKEEEKEIVVEEEVVVEEKPVAQAPKQTKTTNYTQDDLYVLSRIIHAESKGEPYEGKLAVGTVIMNRIKDSWFPNSVQSVVFQTGQFSPVSNGSYYNTPSEKSVKAAKEVLAGNRVLPEGVLYFYNPEIATDPWIRTTRSHRRIGNHMFALPPN